MQPETFADDINRFRRKEITMGEYEPRDSRIVTENPSKTPIEPERTGPREGATRRSNGDTPPRSDFTKTRPVDENERWQVETEESR